jgi:hypothetical protein
MYEWIKTMVRGLSSIYLYLLRWSARPFFPASSLESYIPEYLSMKSQEESESRKRENVRSFLIGMRTCATGTNPDG